MLWLIDKEEHDSLAWLARRFRKWWRVVHAVRTVVKGLGVPLREAARVRRATFLGVYGKDPVTRERKDAWVTQLFLGKERYGVITTLDLCARETCLSSEDLSRLILPCKLE